MISRKRVSMLERAQENSVREFVEHYKSETVKVDVPMDNKGSILVPIDIESDDAKNILTKFRYYDAEHTGDARMFTSGRVINNVTKNMVEIPDYMPFNEAINVIYNTYKNLGDAFYGVFLVNKKKQKFNPLHPISALELMADSSWAQDQYKIYIYMYDETDAEFKRSEFKDYGHVKDTTMIEANIATQIALYKGKKSLVQSVSNTASATDVISSFRRGNTPTLTVANRFTMDETCVSKRPALMIPHNILNNGITIPYYGTSIVTMSTTEGHSITPMMSANIGSDPSTFLRRNRYGSYSVCTGSLSNSTLNGLRSLNHSNLLSPMNSCILMPGWMDYVEKCIDYAFMAYEPILEGYEQKFDETFLEPTFETYMDQWLYENPDKTTLDYIKHVAEKNKELINVNLQQETSEPSVTQTELHETTAQAASPNDSVFIPF